MFCYEQIFRLNQHISSIRTVRDQYVHIYNRLVGIAGLRATFAELIETCRTDTDPVYSSESDTLSRFFPLGELDIMVWLDLVKIK